MTDGMPTMLKVEQDPNDQDELVIQFPDDMMERLGWQEGDMLRWLIEDDKIFVKKVEK